MVFGGLWWSALGGFYVLWCFLVVCTLEFSWFMLVLGVVRWAVFGRASSLHAALCSACLISLVSPTRKLWQQIIVCYGSLERLLYGLPDVEADNGHR